MPSPFGVAAVVVFWLATTAVVVKRDLWPRLFASGPPPIAIDLADEASQLVPVRWNVVRGSEKVGTLTTHMKHVDADDTFRFNNTYRKVALELAGVKVTVPELVSITRVTRAGTLREQGMEGRIVAAVGPVELEAHVKLKAEVVNGQLVGTVAVTAAGLGSFEKPLDPVPVPAGQVLNPLQPVNRLANVRPGLRWVVPEVNPLQDAAAALLKGANVRLPDRRAGDLVAEVADEPETLTVKGKPTPCWVIGYRGRDAVAKTWVRVSDGKVLRQEAFGFGERLALEREE